MHFNQAKIYPLRRIRFSSRNSIEAVCLEIIFSALFAIVLIFSAVRAGASQYVKIGVLADRGVEQCLIQWGPTAEYLTRKLKGVAFEIVPINYAHLLPAVEKKEVNFVLANPAYYVRMEFSYGAQRIATLKDNCLGVTPVSYGGVIFTSKIREDIRSFSDLKDKSFMAVDEHSLGGWFAVWRELKESGVDPYRQISKLLFAGDHDKVVRAVRDGLVDAGSVRTEILEKMAADGDIHLDDFFILNQEAGEFSGFPFLLSTRLYPEWPIAKLQGTSDDLAEKVTVALLQMSSDSTAATAGDCAGWTIPQNYQPVHECLRYLKVGPYRDLGKITPKDVVKSYGHWLALAALAFVGFLVFTLVVLRLNDHIEESRLKLSAEVEERRKTDEELKEAKEIAEDAARAKSVFLANMSHEIRTPMNGVIAAAELALNETLTPKVRHYLKIILSSAHSLLGLINDILDLSKIEAGKLSIEKRGFMLDEIVDRVVDLFFNSASAKRIELLVDIAQEVPRALVGDPLRLQQVFTNLLGNAVKFTDRGGFILIGARVSRTWEDQVELYIWVKDTGVGISAEYLKILFQPFSQADASDTRRYEGTGLGLSICKRLVELMEGQIGVESELGKGSKFYFTARFQTRRTEPRRVLQPPPELKSLHVLVIDDCEESRTIIRHYLESFGFTVENADSGKLALYLISEKHKQDDPFHLIIVDWLMPGMNGLDLSRKIREQYSPGPPIIMMTAFGSDMEKAEAEKSGIQGFLIKPIYQSTLFNAIMDAFGKESYKKRRRPDRITTDAGIYKRRLRGFRVLVVEDNPTNRDIAAAILESAGIVADTAVNGRDAIDKIRKSQFDAVLMDIQMPEMNGFQATRLIHQDSSLKHLPIIAMTAHAMRGDEEKCLSAGMDGYVAKPVDQARLFRLLWRLLKNRRPVLEDAGLPSEKEPESSVVRRDLGKLTEHAPGIDIPGVLEKMRLEPEVYLKIISGFCKNNKDIVDSLRQAFEEQNFERISGLAHTLKGSAGNIGAKPLEEAARELESAAGNRFAGKNQEVLLNRVEAELEVVLSSIQDIEKGRQTLGKEQFPEEVVFSPAAGKVLEEMAEALRHADPARINRIASRLQNLVSRDDYLQLKRKMEQYDYDEALEIVLGIRDALKREGVQKETPK